MSRGRVIALVVAACCGGRRARGLETLPRRDDTSRVSVNGCRRPVPRRERRRRRRRRRRAARARRRRLPLRDEGQRDRPTPACSARPTTTTGSRRSRSAEAAVRGGAVERWQVLGGRWGERDLVPDQGGGLLRTDRLRRIPRILRRNRANRPTPCTGDPASKRSAPPGRQDRSTASCHSDEGDTATSESLVEAIEKVDVGGKPFDASRTRPPTSSSTARSAGPPSVTTGDRQFRRAAAAAGDEQRREAERHDRRRLPRELLAAAALGRPAPVVGARSRARSRERRQPGAAAPGAAEDDDQARSGPGPQGRSRVDARGDRPGSVPASRGGVADPPGAGAAGCHGVGVGARSARRPGRSGSAAAASRASTAPGRADRARSAALLPPIPARHRSLRPRARRGGR